MKKLICIFLVVAVLSGFAACKTVDTASDPSASETPASETPASETPATDTSVSETPASDTSASDTPDAQTKEEMLRAIIGDEVGIYPEFYALVGGDVGYITDDVDHHARETYDLALIGTSSNAATTNTYNGFVQFSNYFNFNIEQAYSEGDNDKYVTMMETYALQGKDGFVLSPDNNVFERIKEVADELEVPYIFILTPYYAEDGKNLVPCVGEDDGNDGSIVMNWLLDNYQDRLGDIDLDKVGVMGIQFSVVYAFQQRVQSSFDVWRELYPDREDQLYVVDTAAQDNPISQEAAYNEVTAMISAHPEIEYWIISAAAGLYANGAARACEALGIDDKVIMCSIGIEELINEWNAGYDGCWAACVSTKPNIYSMPMIAGILALVDGRATPETLWEEVRAPGDPTTYFIVDVTVITKDSYIDYTNACDVLAAKFTIE